MKQINFSKLPLPLKTPLKTADAWLRLQDAVRWLFPEVTAGLAVTLALVWAGRFYPLTFPVVLLMIGLSLTFSGLLLAWLYLWFRPRSPLAVARLLDRRLALEERLSTSVELAANQETPIPDRLVQAQLEDTLRHLQKFDPPRCFPLRFSWRWVAAATLLSVMILVSLVLPNTQVDILAQQAQTQALLEAQAAQLEEIRAELLAEQPLLETPEAETLRQTLDELIQSLKEGQLSPEEALAELAEAEQELANLQEANEQKAGLNDLAEAFNQYDATGELAEAIEQRDFSRAAEALASSGQGATDPQSREELAQALEAAAQAAEESGNSELAEALNEAAQALEGSASSGENSQAMEEALQQAGQALAEAGEALADQEAVEEALANIREAREQLTGTDEQEGQQAQGQGQQPGAGMGEGQGQGQQPGPDQGGGGQTGGAGREDPGPGAEGILADQGSPDEMSTDNGPNEGRTSEYQSIYAPLHLGGEGGPLVNPDPQGAEGGVPVGTIPVDPNQEPNPALVPYNEVYGQYNEAAGQALDDNYIPLGMKSYIRNYFGSLEPE